MRHMEALERDGNEHVESRMGYNSNPLGSINFPIGSHYPPLDGESILYKYIYMHMQNTANTYMHLQDVYMYMFK